MVWKFILIEFIESLSIISLLLGLVCIPYTVWQYAISYYKNVNGESKIIKKGVFIFITFISVSILIPSKTLMYTALAVNQIENYIEATPELKEINSKVITILNNKLDEFIDKKEDK